MKYLVPLVAVLLGVTACKEPDDPPKPQAPAQAAQETVFDGMIDAKTRAKEQTEQAMEKSRANLDEGMKKAEGPTE